jgi:hypothetical protein
VTSSLWDSWALDPGPKFDLRRTRLPIRDKPTTVCSIARLSSGGMCSVRPIDLGTRSGLDGSKHNFTRRNRLCLLAAALALARRTLYGPSRRPAAIFAVSGATMRIPAQRVEPILPENSLPRAGWRHSSPTRCQETHATQPVAQIPVQAAATPASLGQGSQPSCVKPWNLSAL